MKSRVKIALAQISMHDDPSLNLVKTLHCIDDAAAQGAELIVFPESQFSPYFPQFPNQDASRYLVTLNSPLIEEMQAKCRQRRIVATANVYLADGPHSYCATVMIDSDGEILGCSKKMHITRAPLFYEQDYFSASDEGFLVYATDVGRLGVVMCYDRHYPESFRACALQGAHIVIIPTGNIAAENLEMFEWEIRVAAFQNNLYAAMCNRVGTEHAMTFAGGSLIVDPNGVIVAKGAGAEQMIYADLDYQLVHDSRQERPYLRLRHPNLANLIREGSDCEKQSRYTNE
jgi:beta-ureidopropionase